MVKIKNISKNKLVLEKAQVGDSFFKRLKGLMGRKDLGDNEGLIIKPCNSVHTFGMKFNIDVAFVDKDNRICHLIHNMGRRKISPVVKASKFVIEARAGRFEEVDLELGDIIDIL